MESGIRVEGLTKRFVRYEKQLGLRGSFARLMGGGARVTTALDGVSFRIEPGELVGYIGPNGAGKSTTVKILAGILRPDSGRCVIDGLVPYDARKRHVARIGVVFGQRSQLLWDLPPQDSFDLMRDIYRIPASDYEKTRATLVDCLDVGDFLVTPVRQLSLGQRMRCEVIASLLHRPSLLFLDEPTIGLDAISKRALRSFVSERNRADGLTVILTTHDMDDVEALCSRVMVIGHGKILADGPTDALRENIGKRRLTAVVARDAELEMPFGATAVERAPGRIVIDFDPDRVSGELLVRLLAEGCGLLDVTIEHPRIEDVIAQVYERLDA